MTQRTKIVSMRALKVTLKLVSKAASLGAHLRNAGERLILQRAAHKTQRSAD